MNNQRLKWSCVVSVLLLLGSTNILSSSENRKLELTELPKNMTWVNIVVFSDKITLSYLASMYYGDEGEASLIYEANKEVIPKSKKLKKGMKLKMPVTDKFIDQPEHLGWN
ncbi:hypothetical protein MNB_SV-14-581 [hydrothermal vent metagenome]|uniref:LysM domain-containing protein n=1 Tax=hydrothermal vent metagenome TaxID=652676 RepID=A0A1W1CQX7_9ZZZZ